MNTHYAVLVFAGDFDDDHPDEQLRGLGPSMMLIGAGPEDFCWEALSRFLEHHPLRRDEHAEVLRRDPALVQDAQERAASWGFHYDDPGLDEGPQGPPPAANA